jgi:hypothetical protein
VELGLRECVTLPVLDNVPEVDAVGERLNGGDSVLVTETVEHAEGDELVDEEAELVPHAVFVPLRVCVGQPVELTVDVTVDVEE